jgi:hypothetical protein
LNRAEVVDGRLDYFGYGEERCRWCGIWDVVHGICMEFGMVGWLTYHQINLHQNIFQDEIWVFDYQLFSGQNFLIFSQLLRYRKKTKKFPKAFAH